MSLEVHGYNLVLIDAVDSLALLCTHRESVRQHFNRPHLDRPAHGVATSQQTFAQRASASAMSTFCRARYSAPTTFLQHSL